jgi:hypothetical protein
MSLRSTIRVFKLSIVCLTTLQVAQTVCRRIRGSLVNDELKRVLKVAVVTLSEALSEHSSGWTEKIRKYVLQIWLRSTASVA